MSRPSLGQTATPVHSMQAMRRLRRGVFAHDQYALTGVCLYAQLIMGAGLYLYGHVSTPGYLSVLLTLPVSLSVYYLSMYLAGRGGIAACGGNALGKALGVLLALLSLMDAQLALYTLCAVLSEILPSVSTFLGAMAVAVITALSIGGGDEYALSRLSRFMRWGLLIAFVYAAAGAAAYGSVGHLSPWLGYGAGTVGQGALWMSGCAAGCCFPLLLPQDGQTLNALRTHRNRGLRIILISTFLGALTALFSAYLMPVYALARPETLGFRMLLISHINPSLLGWSLLTCGTLFLLLLSLAAGVTRAAGLIAFSAGRKKSSPALNTLLLLLLVPVAALNTFPAEEILLTLLPWRGAAALVILGILLVTSFARKRGEEAP